MSDISEGLGIVHRAGCQGPGIVAAMPFATMTGRNPYITLVADGKGGEVFQCRLCGMIEGQTPPPEARRPGRPKESLAISEAAFDAAHDKLADAHGRDPYNRELEVELIRYGPYAVRSAHQRYHGKAKEQG